MLHTLALRDLLRDVPIDDPHRVASEWAVATDESVGGWYEDTNTYDRLRLGEVQAEVDGVPYEPEDPEWEAAKGLESAIGQDPELLRAFLRVASVHQRVGDVMAGPGVADRVSAARAHSRDEARVGPSRQELPGPSRAEGPPDGGGR